VSACGLLFKTALSTEFTVSGISVKHCGHGVPWPAGRWLPVTELRVNLPIRKLTAVSILVIMFNSARGLKPKLWWLENYMNDEFDC
jgi:hypothetical protein